MSINMVIYSLIELGKEIGSLQSMITLILIRSISLALSNNSTRA